MHIKAHSKTRFMELNQQINEKFAQHNMHKKFTLMPLHLRILLGVIFMYIDLCSSYIDYRL